MVSKCNRTPLYGAVEGNNWHLRPEIETPASGGHVRCDLSQGASEIAGILVINGAKVLYLNNTAYGYVDLFLRSGCDHRKTAWQAALRFRITPGHARRDWELLYRNLSQASVGCCEGAEIQVMSEERHFTAPLRVDLALTYLCNNDCYHCYAGGSHATDELTTDEWRGVIDKLHAAGVPQVIFTGGESLMRPDLELLANHAKRHHMITGLITNGRLLTRERVDSLAQAGLDFVQITVESIDPVVHNAMVGFPMEVSTASSSDCECTLRQNIASSTVNPLAETLAGVRNAIDSSLQVTTNTTITPQNASTVLATITHLIEIGVERVGINGLIRAERGKEADGLPADEMKSLLQKIRQICQEKGAQMIWFTPTCYRQLNPISLDLGVKSCSAASIVLAIEPTGRVIPCQSYFEGLGDARYDDFASIWNHPLALRIRDKTWVKESCRACKHLTTCGGGCPLEQGC